MNLTNLFNPKSIALVGASNTSDKLGNYLANNLIQSGFGGKLYFLNPKKENILGQQALQNPLEIPENIDLWVVAIPANLVMEVIQQIVLQKQKFNPDLETFLVIISSGFKEKDQAGAILENQILELCKQYKIRLIGPNCLGIINNQPNSIYKYNASFAVAPRLFGGISFISQSGAMISGLVNKAQDFGLGFNKIISLGNQADLETSDFLEFLIDDQQTKVIGLYVEGFLNGHKFVELAKKSLKPIIILKVGDSVQAQKTITSHTGSIAGNSQTAKAYLESAGCVVTENLEEFFDSLLLFSKWQ